MGQRTFTVTASAIFGIVALLHVLRIFFGWPAVIGGWTVPMWLSWIGLIVAGGLSYLGIHSRHARLMHRKQTAVTSKRPRAH